MKLTKQQIHATNKKHIQPTVENDDFLRLNMLNYVRSEFKHEAKQLQPIGTGQIDFTNIYNMSAAWDYVLQNLTSRIGIYEIREINSIISQNNDQDICGGSFRHSMALVLGQPAPKPEKIYELLDNAVYNLHSDNNSILTKAFNIHYDIITTQPFSDFNKRTARIIMNWYLLQNKYTPILFNHKTDNQEYTKNLKARLNGDNKTYTKYMCEKINHGELLNASKIQS